MEIKRAGSQPSAKGPSEWFTGAVRIDPLFQAPDPALVQGASVTFEPGARTAWHTHPLGQTLIVTAGCGRVQRWGGPARGMGGSRPVVGAVADRRLAPCWRSPGRRFFGSGRVTQDGAGADREASITRFASHKGIPVRAGYAQQVPLAAKIARCLAGRCNFGSQRCRLAARGRSSRRAARTPNAAQRRAGQSAGAFDIF